MPNRTTIEHELHSRLIDPTSTEVVVYQQIPTVAAWRGDIAKAMNRLQQMRRAVGGQRHLVASIRFAGGGWFAKQQPVQQPGRRAGDLANATLIDAAIERYQSGAASAGAPDNQLAKSIHGSLLVDIYTVTGQFVRNILRNTNLRTDNDCALFPLYRALHYAAADVFGRVFGINGDQIDVYLRQQLIFMSNHGVEIDHKVGRRMHNDQSQLCYLSDAGAMACRLSIEDGKFKIVNRAGELELFDCSGGEFMDEGNPAWQGSEQNNKKGVAGFAMGLDRRIYAHKHSLPGKGTAVAGPGSNFYHSSYLGGREVLCTGCITVVKGELTYINNWSGHYQPSPQQLSLAVQGLRAQGVNIENVLVEYPDGRRSVRQLAPKFLAGERGDGMDFDGFSKGRFMATARKIREALAAYEKRSKRWYASPSQQSLGIMKRLMEISDDEQLVREVRFLLGEGRGEFGMPIKGKFAASPFQTPKEEVLLARGGELFEQLSIATAADVNY